MGWFDDYIVDPIKDSVEAVGDFFTDPLGALEDLGNATLNLMTLGTFGYAKDKFREFIQGLIPEQTFQDRQRTVRSADEPKTVIYGKIRTGGHLVYVEDDGKDKIILWMCHVLAGHEVEEIEAVYFNEVKYATSNGPGVNGVMQRNTGSEFGNNILCWSVHGNRSSAFIPSANIDSSDNSYDGTFSPPNWTSSHRLSGQAYVWTQLVFDKETFGDTGVPTIKFDVRGKNDIYDPRNGSTGYTDNHALATLDTLRWDRLLDIPDGEIDTSAFVDAANLADEQVASGVGTTEKRYTVNGTFKMLAAPLDILQSVARAGASFPIYTQGMWSIVPGSYSAPVMDLNEDDLIGGLSFQPGPGKSNRHNVATGTFIDPNQDYESVGFSELYVSDYVTQDGEVLEKDFQFAWTNSPTMARRLAKIDIERNRFGTAMSAVFKFKSMRLSPGDRVNVYNTRLGWTPKIFRVESLEVSFGTGVKLDLREDSPDIYAWEEGDALALDPPPVLSIPDGLAISPPSGITVEEELYRTLTRAAVKVKLLLAWTEQPSALAYDIQHKKATATKWVDVGTFWQDNEIEIPDVDDDLYDIRLRSINGIGRKSAWTTLQHDVVGKSAPPDDVPLLFVEKRTLKWTYPDEPVDFSGFLVRFQNGDRQFWADATPMHEGIVTETIFDVSEFSGVKTFLVKAVDTTGNVSLNPAILVQGLGDVPIDNVIATQNEAPDWLSKPQEFNLQVRSGGLVENLFVRGGTTEDQLIVLSDSTYTGAFINDDGFIEGEEIGGFYGDSTAIFYSSDHESDFYGAEYKRIEYRLFFTVSAQDEGASLSVDTIVSAEFNENLTYIPPNYSGLPLAFPGSLDAIAGEYEFLFSIPQQQATSPPIVEDIITRLDVEDIQERLGDVAIAAGGTRLPILKTYREIVTVNLTLQDDGGTAVTLRVDDKDTALGPLVTAYNDAGTSVSATIDALVQGY